MEQVWVPLGREFRKERLELVGTLRAAQERPWCDHSVRYLSAYLAVDPGDLLALEQHLRQ